MDIKVLGLTDDVTECHCCGKLNLKQTVAFEIDGNETYYGTTCATKFYKKELKDIKAEIKTNLDKRLREARILYRSTPEYVAYNQAIKEANGWTREPGSYERRREFLRPFVEANDHKKDEIASAFRVSRSLLGVA